MDKSEAGKLGASVTAAQRKAIREAYYLDPKRCPKCETTIDFQSRKSKRFCSHSCSASFLGLGGSKPRLERRIFNCAHCQVPTEAQKTSRNRFCSTACSSSFLGEKNYKGWLDGTFLISPSSIQVIRKYVIRLNGYSCSDCGLDEWRGLPITLELDHRDGNFENNRPENVRLLCPNCHSQTPTYGAKNKGKGRHFRRERYANGLSR